MDRIIEKKRGIKKKHIPWIAGGAALLALILYIIFSDHRSAYRTSEDKVTVSAVEEGVFNDYITIIGKVEPLTTVYLDAQESGQVSARFIEEGAMVKQGDIILKLDNKQLYGTILQSEASVAEKENYLRNTKINFEQGLIQNRKNILQTQYQISRLKRKYEQQKSLFDKNLISQEDYLIAKEDYEYQKRTLELDKLRAKNDSIMSTSSMRTLEGDLATMRQMVGLVHERMNNLYVKAPVDGQLGMLNAEVGQSINQGQRIGMLHVLKNFKVSAMIDEHYIDRVQPELKATVERNGKEFKMTVKKVYPEVRNGQFQIDLVFEGNLPENIRTGQTFHIKMQLGESTKAIMVTRGGFFQSTGGQWIYVVDKSGKQAVKRNIKIGRQNPQYYEVLEGLQPGEKVITSGYELFGDNERIVLK